MNNPVTYVDPSGQTPTGGPASGYDPYGLTCYGGGVGPIDPFCDKTWKKWLDKWTDMWKIPRGNTDKAFCDSLAQALKELCKTRCYKSPKYITTFCFVWHKWNECVETWKSKLPDECGKKNQGEFEKVTLGCGEETKWPPPYP